MALCGGTGELAPLAARSAVPDQHFHGSLPSPGSLVALCGGTRPETREFGRIRGVVRKNRVTNQPPAERDFPVKVVSVAVHMVRPEDLALVRMIPRRAIEAV